MSLRNQSGRHLLADARRNNARTALQAAVLSLAFGAGLAMSVPASAQDTTAGAALWRSSGCTTCHGALAEGGDGGEMPAGPSIRSSRLNATTMAETIACGRPGTGMPAFLNGAYTRVACRGLPVGPPPARTQVIDMLTPDQVTALTAFLTTRVVGQGPTTKELCGHFYGNPENAACASYR